MTAFKRLENVQDSLLMLGAYVVSSNKKVRTILFPKKVVLNDTASSEVLMGTTIDSTLVEKPEYCELHITHNVVVLVEENSAPPTFVVGNSFNKVSAPLLSAFMAKDTVDYVLVKLPCSYPIPHGVPLTSGKLTDQTIFDTLAMINEDGAHWASLMGQFDPLLQTTVLDTRQHYHSGGHHPT